MAGPSVQGALNPEKRQQAYLEPYGGPREGARLLVSEVPLYLVASREGLLVLRRARRFRAP